MADSIFLIQDGKLVASLAADYESEDLSGRRWPIIQRCSPAVPPERETGWTVNAGPVRVSPTAHLYFWIGEIKEHLDPLDFERFVGALAALPA